MTSSNTNAWYSLLPIALFAFISLLGAPQVLALKSDSEQPATINADDVELDFKTGERTYTGNVFLRQGSMELTCDKLVATFVDDKLAVATAYGSAEKLAVFKQRPEGKETDVVGKAVTMILDQTEQLVTLSENASLVQGTDTVTGKKILYDMELEKMNIKGSEIKMENPTGSAEPAKSKPENTEPAQSEQLQDTTQSDSPTGSTEPDTDTESVSAGASQETASTNVTPVTQDSDDNVITESDQMVVPNDSVLSRGTSGRPRMIIQPRSKRNPLN